MNISRKKTKQTWIFNRLLESNVKRILNLFQRNLLYIIEWNKIFFQLPQGRLSSKFVQSGTRFNFMYVSFVSPLVLSISVEPYIEPPNLEEKKTNQNKVE